MILKITPELDKFRDVKYSKIRSSGAPNNNNTLLRISSFYHRSMDYASGKYLIEHFGKEGFDLFKDNYKVYVLKTNMSELRKISLKKLDLNE